MPKIISVEVAKDLNNPNIREASSEALKNVHVRNTEMSTLQNGDILAITADAKFLEQTMRNGQKNEAGELPKAIFAKVAVYRKGAWKVTNFYPSSMWKSRQIAKQVSDIVDPTKMVWEGTGEFKRATGTAAEEVQQYSEFADFWKDSDGKFMKIGVSEPLNTIAFGTYQKTTICSFDFCELPEGVTLPE